MTIIVKRRSNPIASNFTDMFDYIGEKKEDAQRRINKNEGARIRRYAKRKGFELRYHPRPWTFRSVAGRVQIAMPAGYFAKVDGVLHQLIPG